VLDVLFWGLKASPFAWTSFMEAKGYVNCNFWSKKYIKKLSPEFFQFLIKMLDPESINRIENTG
jgi:hypothetical protein